MKFKQQIRIVFSLMMLLGTTFWWGCQKEKTPVEVETTYKAEQPQAWMELAYNAVKRQGWFPLDASRFYGYVAITAYESMIHSIPNGRSLAGQLQGLNTLPQPEAGKKYDWGIVLCHAMPQVMEELMPSMANESRTAMNTLALQQEAATVNENTLSDEVTNNSKAFAKELSNAIIEWSRTDNRLGMESLVYTPPSNVGNPQYWEGSTLGQTFLMPFWWTSRPFVIPSYRLCEIDAPYTYSEDPNSIYYKEVKEVYDASFDPAKVTIGKYWANSPGKSGTPAGSWLGIANELVDEYQLDLHTTLKMYALLAIGTRDCFISTWYLKYKYNLQRPVSYIRNVMGHTDWSSPITTPPYPDYTSGVSVNAGASSETLTRMFGVRGFEDKQHFSEGLGVRKFASFKQAGIEAYHSRIFGGVHMRRACELGFVQGECISEYLWNNLQFEK